MTGLLSAVRRWCATRHRSTRTDKPEDAVDERFRTISPAIGEDDEDLDAAQRLRLVLKIYQHAEHPLEKLGIDQNAVNAVLAGARELTAAEATSIETGIGIPTPYLRGGPQVHKVTTDLFALLGLQQLGDAQIHACSHGQPDGDHPVRAVLVSIGRAVFFDGTHPLVAELRTLSSDTTRA